MIPQLIEPTWDEIAICSWMGKWAISPALALRLVTMAQRLPFGIQIFSGFRTCDEQNRLEVGTKATCAQSTHTSCPATGADIQPVIGVNDGVKLELGRVGITSGLRWGGGAPIDNHGIPIGVEWHHFDLGPRGRSR